MPTRVSVIEIIPIDKPFSLALSRDNSSMAIVGANCQPRSIVVIIESASRYTESKWAQKFQLELKKTEALIEENPNAFCLFVCLGLTFHVRFPHWRSIFTRFYLRTSRLIRVFQADNLCFILQITTATIMFLTSVSDISIFVRIFNFVVVCNIWFYITFFFFNKNHIHWATMYWSSGTSTRAELLEYPRQHCFFIIREQHLKWMQMSTFLGIEHLSFRLNYWRKDPYKQPFS